MTDIFVNVLSWLIKLVFFVPFQVIKLVGLLLPTCSSVGIVNFSNDALLAMINWIRFLWPVIQYFPWSFFWNFLSAMILYILVKWLWSLLPWLSGLGFKVWIVIAVLYGIGGVISIFTNLDWQSSPAFTEVLGSSSTVNGAVGGGFGGGGGGSW